MSTISENLQTIKSSTDAIKQAIIDKGGTIEGNITTWADAISGIETGGGTSEEYVFAGTLSYNMTTVTITGDLNNFPNTGRNYLLALGWNTIGLCYASTYISNIGPHTLTVDFDEPITSDCPAICILNIVGSTYTAIPVKFEEVLSTDPA